MVKRNLLNSPVSFIALIIVLYLIVIPLIIAVLCGVFGSIPEVINKVVEFLPFGEGILHLTIGLFSALTSQAVSFQETQGYLSFTYVLGEMAKAMFTIIVFEALNRGLFFLLGLNEKGYWIRLKKVCVMVFNALLAPCLAPFLMNFVTDWLSQLVSSGQFSGRLAGNILFCVLFAVVAVAAIMIMQSWAGLGFGMSIAYVLGKTVVLDFIRLLCSYLCILLILLFWQTGNYGMMIPACGGLLGVALIFAGIDLMLDPLLKP